MRERCLWGSCGGRSWPADPRAAPPGRSAPRPRAARPTAAPVRARTRSPRAGSRGCSCGPVSHRGQAPWPHPWHGGSSAPRHVSGGAHAREAGGARGSHMSGFAAGLALGVAFGAVAGSAGEAAAPPGGHARRHGEARGRGLQRCALARRRGCHRGHRAGAGAMGLPGGGPTSTVLPCGCRSPRAAPATRLTCCSPPPATRDGAGSCSCSATAWPTVPSRRCCRCVLPAGPLLLRLAPVHGAPVRPLGAGLAVPTRLALSYAVGTGPGARGGGGAGPAQARREGDPRRHDPIVHQLPGTSQYPVVQALREPAYAAARLVSHRG